MAILQINPPGMASTDPGYVSSITIRTAGAPTVLVPNGSTGQITVDAPCATQWAAVSVKQNVLVSG
jgi:hypothetical protein